MSRIYNTMSDTLLLKNANLVNEGTIIEVDILIKGDRIEQIGAGFSVSNSAKIIDMQGDYLIPGLIDDQVHFREPGLTHKATIRSEAIAGLLGGVTSFMEMPNTAPPATTSALLEAKYAIGSATSPANFSFFAGATNHNAAELTKLDFTQICGIKAFLGSSTGDLLVDDEKAIADLFSLGQLIATHCEDEQTIRANVELYRNLGKTDPSIHPEGAGP